MLDLSDWDFIGLTVFRSHVYLPLTHDQTITSIGFAGYNSSSISQLERELAKQILK